MTTFKDIIIRLKKIEWATESFQEPLYYGRLLDELTNYRISDPKLYSRLNIIMLRISEYASLITELLRKKEFDPGRHLGQFIENAVTGSTGKSQSDELKDLLNGILEKGKEIENMLNEYNIE